MQLQGKSTTLWLKTALQSGIGHRNLLIFKYDIKTNEMVNTSGSSNIQHKIKLSLIEIWGSQVYGQCYPANSSSSYDKPSSGEEKEQNVKQVFNKL